MATKKGTIKVGIAKETAKTVISNNVFQGVVWDAKAVEAVTIVAQGLLNLTELFKSQNIQIDAMLKIDSKEE